MSLRVLEAVTDADWSQGLSVLERVYVGEGHSEPARAQEFYRREVLEREGTFLVAVMDDRVLGAVLLLNADSSLRQVAQADEREFRVLAVLPETRGSGVGRALVEACIERVRGAHGLVLWTRPVMVAAQRLYERVGFVRVPERDTEDPRGFARLVYRIQLA